jgi:putative ABC transport system substrate-binding protein
MRRREFITLVGGAAAWPLAAHSQQPVMPVVGFLSGASSAPWAPYVAAFRRGLKETGHVEGQNIAIEFRWADSQYDRLPAMAADLVRRQVAVIVAGGGTSAVMAAKAATATIPVVFSTGGDPVELGVVASIHRPGGNLTGVANLTGLLEVKRLEIMREVVPNDTLIAVLMDPRSPYTSGYADSIRDEARSMGQRITILNAGTDAEIENAFAALKATGAQALLVAGQPFFNVRREFLVAQAARHGVPTIYEFREYAVAGGLMSYGTSVSDGYRQIGIYAGRILKGEKPADLPIYQVTKFELVINLKAAKALRLDVPPSLLGRADEVIE